MVPMFSWPMITGLLEGGSQYNFTSVPQIPATSIFNRAQSGVMSGIGNSRISVLPGPTLTAASTLSTVVFLPSRQRSQGPVYHAVCPALPVQLQSKLNLPLAGLRRAGELAGVRDQVSRAVENLHLRRLEIRMVEQVERFGAELEPCAVTEQGNILEQREVVLLQPR